MSKELLFINLIFMILVILIYYFRIKNEKRDMRIIKKYLNDIKDAKYEPKNEKHSNKELNEVMISLELLYKTILSNEKSLKDTNIQLETSVKNYALKFQEMINKMHSIEKSVAAIYTEKDEVKMIVYILNLLVSSVGMNYKMVLFMKYDIESDLILPFVFCDKKQVRIFNDIDDKQSTYFSGKINNNCVSDSFIRREILNRDKKGEKLSIMENIVFENFVIYPIYFAENGFGVVVVQNEGSLIPEEIEIVKTFTDNISICLENMRLQKEELKNKELKTLIKLSGSIVHELRTPLTTIRGLSAMLSNKYPGEEKIANYSKTIINESKKIESIASELLSYAEGKRQKIEGEELNINAVVSEVLNSMADEISSNNCEVGFETSDETIMYYGDKLKLIKVFENLVKNSLEATKGFDDKITIKINVEKNGIRILLIDEGLGISKEIVPKIFDPLVTTKIEGCGLGLTIVKDILQLHNNSTISIRDNQYPCGTIVEIVLR